MQVMQANNYVTGATTPRTRKDELDAEAFLMLLTVQLATQNPLEPMNDRDFFAQMAQLGTVTGLGRVERSMQLSQAASLMGKTVTAVRHSMNGEPAFPVTGVVERVYLQGGEHWLSLRTAEGALVDAKMSNIQSVAF